MTDLEKEFISSLITLAKDTMSIQKDMLESIGIYYENLTCFNEAIANNTQCIFNYVKEFIKDLDEFTQEKYTDLVFVYLNYDEYDSNDMLDFIQCLENKDEIKIAKHLDNRVNKGTK